MEIEDCEDLWVTVHLVVNNRSKKLPFVLCITLDLLI